MGPFVTLGEGIRSAAETLAALADFGFSAAFAATFFTGATTVFALLLEATVFEEEAGLMRSFVLGADFLAIFLEMDFTGGEKNLAFTGATFFLIATGFFAGFTTALGEVFLAGAVFFTTGLLFDSAFFFFGADLLLTAVFGLGFAVFAPLETGFEAVFFEEPDLAGLAIFFCGFLAMAMKNDELKTVLTFWLFSNA